MLTVRAPASSGNLGSGFDALSMALELCNEFSVEPAERLVIENAGEGSEKLSGGEDHLVYRAIARAHAATGGSVPPVRLRCENRIPLSRGLGSSSSAIVAGLLLGNRLQGDPLSHNDLLVLATEMEGHPDNVVSCLLGGIQVGVESDGQVLTCPVPIRLPLRAILFVPDFAMNTSEARRVLPQRVPLPDAVFNLGRSALLVAALANGRPELLKAALEDRLHQPARTALFPAMPAMFKSALEAGALAACLSGAGSTILALATDGVAAISGALEECAARHGLSGAARVVSIRETGAELLDE
jgi:homoserine kinase